MVQGLGVPGQVIGEHSLEKFLIFRKKRTERDDLALRMSVLYTTGRRRSM